MFTPDQLRQLDISGARFRPADDRTGPACQWSHNPYEPIEGYLVMRATDQGPETAFGNPRGTRVTTIAGFPAIETQGLYSSDNTHCMVLVGVAAGQTLQVQYDYTGTALPMTRELACQKARSAAELAMQTLIEKAGA